MDFEWIKGFARKGFLPKEIATCKIPLYSFCIQVKQTRISISTSATSCLIKANNLHPSSKISCDYYHFYEPSLVVNNNSQILAKEYATYGTVIVDHVSEYIFLFTQTSVEGS